MTAEQMRYEAELIYESIASDAAPGYEPREWSHLLTSAQEEVVLDIVKMGIDRDESYRKSIAPLLNNVEATVSGGDLLEYTDLENSQFVNIDSNAMIVTLERGFIDINESTTKRVSIIPHSLDFVMANVDNPFKKPDKSYEFWRCQGYTDLSKIHILIHDGTELDSYKYVEVIKPKPIIVPDSYTTDDGQIDGENFSDNNNGLDCELGVMVHRKIADKAARLAYAADKDQVGYQIQAAEEANK